MKTGDSRSPAGPGYLPLQDHGYEGLGAPVENRCCVVGVRVRGRLVGTGQLGHWDYDPDGEGDLVGALCWPKDSRAVPGWSWAWPVVVLGGATGQTVAYGKDYMDAVRAREAAARAPQRGAGGGGGGTAGPGAISDAGSIAFVPASGPGNITTPHDAFSPRGSGGAQDRAGGAEGNSADTGPPPVVRPTGGVQRAVDARYARVQSPSPPGWPAFPGGLHGVVVLATDENRQIEYYHPTDPRLVAPHFAGPAAASSLVADLTHSGGAIDLARQARLTSMVRVLRSPSNAPNDASGTRTRMNALALVLGPSGQEDVRGGYAIDLWDSDATKARAVSRGIRELSNPNAQVQVDEYEYDDFGRVVGIRASHVVETFFTRQFSVGSRILEFETSAKGKPQTVVAMLSKNDRGPFDTGPSDDKHRIGSDADGHAINPMHITTDALFRMDILRDAPILFETRWERDAADWEVPTLCHLAYDPETDRWRIWTTTMFQESEPVRAPAETRTVARPKLPPTITPGTGGPRGDEGATGPDGAENAEIASEPDRMTIDFSPRSALSARRELMLPAISARPQYIEHGVLDFRYHVGRAPRRAREEYDANTPVVGRLEAFGKQLAAGDWSRTQARGLRHRGGTGPGGWAILPPEIDMSADEVDYAPDGVTLSETYLVSVPGTRIAFGYPSLDSGALRDGFSIAYDPSAAELGVRYHTPPTGGAVADLLKLSGEGHVFLANRTGDPSTPTGGVYVYAKSGALWAKGSGGTATEIAVA